MNEYGLDKNNALLKCDAVTFANQIAQPFKSLMYMGRPSWPGCPRLVKPLNQIAMEKGVTIYYLNTEEDKIVYKMLCEKYGFKGVPAVFIVSNGQLVDYLYSDKWMPLLYNSNFTVLNEEVLEEFINQAL